MIKKMLKNKQGFTLVELIVVIALLGILAGIAVPKYSGMKAKAYQVADEQVIMAMNKAIELYNVENDKYPSSANEAKEAIKMAYDTIPDVEQGIGLKFYYDKDAKDNKWIVVLNPKDNPNTTRYLPLY